MAKINIDLLKECLDKDGWTSNAIKFISEAVARYDMAVYGLKRFGSHIITCPAADPNHPEGTECNCGLWDTKKNAYPEEEVA